MAIGARYIYIASIWYSYCNFYHALATLARDLQ